MSNLQEASDLENNVYVSARRFEDAPFVARTECQEMIRAVYDGRLHDAHMVDLPFFDRDKNIVRGVDRSIPERPET